LISAELGQERSLLNRIRQLKNITEVHETYGVYDLIAVVEGETQSEINEIVAQNIRSLEGLKTTLTMLVLE
jgi:DNA-binding Lrp family transcriptional regulator